jgi:hypothetical protein
MSDKEYSPFDFIKSASKTKNNLIDTASDPEYVEKLYVPYIVNKGFGLFPDTILHANEMNRMPDIPNASQYSYYLATLRPANRFKKWNKLSSDDDLDLVQQYYQCNRNIAKQYLKVLSPENIKTINTYMVEGGHGKK